MQIYDEIFSEILLKLMKILREILRKVAEIHENYLKYYKIYLQL